jgi:hypothetical protein
MKVREGINYINIDKSTEKWKSPIEQNKRLEWGTFDMFQVNAALGFYLRRTYCTRSEEHNYCKVI